MKFLAATGNLHKIEEFKQILGPLGITFVSPAEIGGIPEINETGKTFEENASLKALEAANFAKMKVFADDSGLEVEDLDNAPGIYSARYADNNNGRIKRVLQELEKIESRLGEIERKARFVCVIAIAEPRNIIKTFRGEVYGKIIRSPRGNAGFGYDPIFQPDGFDQTFAELSPGIKDSISHRANALKKAADYFRK